MMKIKKISALLVAICLMFPLLPNCSTVYAAGLKGSDYTSGVLAERLDNIFNYGISDHVSPALPKVGEEFPRSQCYTVSFYNTGRPEGSWSGYQCIAYTYAAYNALFHWDTALNRSENFSEAVAGVDTVNYELFQRLGIRFGAYIRTTSNRNGSFNFEKGHSVLVLSYDASGITTLDAVCDNSTSPYYSRVIHYTWSDFNRSLLSGKNRVINNILQPPKSVYDGLGAASDTTQPKTYTVTFDPNGGYIFQRVDGSYVYTWSETYTPGESSSVAFPGPSKDGYTFNGWFTAKSGGQRVYPTHLPSYPGNLTLYAQWTKNEDPVAPITQSGEWGITIPANYRLMCYKSVDATESSQSISPSIGTYTIRCTQRAVLPNGEIRYYFHTQDGIGLWFVYSDAISDGNTTENLTSAHTHSYERGYEAAHPHRIYMKCSECGDFYYTGETTTMDSCEICNPPASTPTPAPETTPAPASIVWGSWSDWSTTPVNETSTRQVETQQVKVSDAYMEYRYGRYVDPTGRHDCWCETYFRSVGYSSSLQYSDWSTARYPVADTGWTCGYCNGNHIGAASSSGGRSFWNEYRLPDGSYYWEESREVPAVEQTQYRYRDLQN